MTLQTSGCTDVSMDHYHQLTNTSCCILDHKIRGQMNNGQTGSPCMDKAVLGQAGMGQHAVIGNQGQIPLAVVMGEQERV